MQHKLANLMSKTPQPQTEDYHCPICKMCANKEVIQTKEHKWGGGCVTSKKEWQQMEQQLNLEIGKWNLPTQARVKIT